MVAGDTDGKTPRGLVVADGLVDGLDDGNLEVVGWPRSTDVGVTFDIPGDGGLLANGDADGCAMGVDVGSIGNGRVLGRSRLFLVGRELG